MASIRDVINQWKKALRLEITYLKDQGGSSYTITEGKCLRKDQTGATYWFVLATDVLLPDGTPIRIEYKNETATGKIISVEGFDVVLELDSYLGEEIREANLYSNPWELLEALVNRIETILTSPKGMKRIIRLLSGDLPTKHPTENIKNTVHEVTLRAKYNPITYLWGPPGTGKTYTLARVIAKHYLNGKKVLVMAHSNAAVDVLLLEVAEIIKRKNAWKSGEILRYGFSANPKIKLHPDLLSSSIVELRHPEIRKEIDTLESKRARLKSLPYLKDTQKSMLVQLEVDLKNFRSKIKRDEIQFVEDAKVLGVTLSKAAMDSQLYEEEYDLVIIDEASMAYIPQVAFASSLGKKIVVCGDFKQLPPIAMSESSLVNKWLKRDVFEAAKIVEVVNQQGNHRNLVMLTEQRRMHPDISSFTNRFIYNNKVTDHKSVIKVRQQIVKSEPFSNEAATLIDLSNIGAYCLKEASSESRFNLLSALLSMQLILAGRADGIHSIGFIAPYKAQAKLLTTLIRELIPKNVNEDLEENIMAATVHKFQGSERDMIVFDNVDSYPQYRAGMLLTENTSDRLINVAVTRARGKFINLVDKSFLNGRVSEEKGVKRLTEHLYKNNKSYSRNDLYPLLKKTFHPNLQWIGDLDNKGMLLDLAKARTIIISAPVPVEIDKGIWRALKSIENEATITLITAKTEGIQLNRFDHIPRNTSMPFIMIDGEVLWLETSIRRNVSRNLSPNSQSIKVRLISKRIIQLLIRMLNIQKPKLSKQELQRKLVSYRPSYTLSQYLASWDQCPTCGSMRKIDVEANGRINLQCNHCGMRGRVTTFLLQKYLEHVNLRCKTCNVPLDATGEGKNLSAECYQCNEKVDVTSLW